MKIVKWKPKAIMVGALLAVGLGVITTPQTTFASESPDTESVKKILESAKGGEEGEFYSEDFANLLDSLDATKVFGATASDYTKSMAKPTTVTTANWKTKQSKYADKGFNGTSLYKSKQYLRYGIYDGTTEIVGNKLNIEGWSAQINYTHANGTNNATYFVAQNKNRTIVTKGSNTSKNITQNYKWGYPNYSKKCRNSHLDLDKSIAWTEGGASSPDKYAGCYHDFTKVGFKVGLNLDTFFGGSKSTEVYDMFIVNVTGSDTNRILYKKLSSTETVTKDYKGTTNDGKVTWDATGNDKTAVVGDDGDILIRDPITSIVNKKYFKQGTYTITDSVTRNAVPWYYLKGKAGTRTAGIKGWISSVFIQDDGDQTKLRYATSTQKFNIIFKNKETGAELQAKVPMTVGQGKSIIVDTAKYDIITVKGVKWGAEVKGAKITKAFDTKNPPKDIVINYVDELPLKINMVDKESGKVIKTKTVQVKPNGKHTEVADDLLTVSNVKYKRISSLANNKTQTTTYATGMAKLPDMNFYYEKESEQKFNIIFKNKETGAELQAKVPMTVGQGKSIIVDTAKYDIITVKGVKWGAEVKGAKITKAFDTKNPPKDIVINYVDELPLKINMVDKESGKVIKTKTVQVKPNGKHTEVADDLLTVSNVKYKRISSLANNKTQTTTYATGMTKLPDMNFYYEKESAISVRHIQIDSSGKELSTIKTDTLNGFIQDTVTAQAYDTVGKPHDAKLFTDRYFAGRGVGIDGNYSGVETGVLKPHITQDNAIKSGKKTYELLETTQNKVVKFYYMKAVKDPSGKCDISTGLCEPENPNKPVPDGEIPKLPPVGGVDGKDYNDKFVGQTNWFLTKDTKATKDNWLSSTLQTRLVGDIPTTAYARKDGSSKLTVNNKVMFDKKAESDKNTYYLNNVVTKRTVLKEYGVGASNAKVKQVTDGEATASKLKDGATFAKGLTSENKALDNTEAKASSKKDIESQLSYTYTNRFKDTYVPADSFKGQVFKWEYKGTTTDWTTSKDVNRSAKDSMRHILGQDAPVITKAKPKLDLVVGGVAEWTKATTNTNGNDLKLKDVNETITSKTIAEKLALNTQGKMAIGGTYDYANGLEKSAIKNTLATPTIPYANGYTDNFKKANRYFMVDADSSLKNINTLNSTETLTKGKLNKVGFGKVKPVAGTTLVPNTAKYQLGIETTSKKNTDNETITLDTQFRYPMLSNTGFVSEVSKPADNVPTMSSEFNQLKKIYKDTFGEEVATNDKVLFDKTSNYYVPFDNDSTLKPNVTYKNRALLSDVGLSDVKVAFEDEFSYKNYLLGSVLDDTAYAVQKDNLVKKGGAYDKDSITVVTPAKRKELVDFDRKKANPNAGLRATNTKSLDDLITKFNK